jgi:hypothetical protein
MESEFVSNLLIRVPEALVCDSAGNFGWGCVDHDVNECMQLVIGFYRCLEAGGIYIISNE